MRKIAAALLILLSCVGGVRAQQTQAGINNLIGSDILSCGDQCVTAAVLRGVLMQMTTAMFQSQGNFGSVLSPPNTQTGTAYVVAATDSSIIANNSSGTLTLTLPAPASFGGRILMLKTTQAQTVVSVTTNVVPLAGGAAGSAILSGTAGKWATIQSDGTNWIIMAAN